MTNSAWEAFKPGVMVAAVILVPTTGYKFIKELHSNLKREKEKKEVEDYDRAAAFNRSTWC